jgi:hypothetical protein
MQANWLKRRVKKIQRAGVLGAIALIYFANLALPPFANAFAVTSLSRIFGEDDLIGNIFAFDYSQDDSTR